MFFAMAVSLASINVNGAAERHKRLRVFESLRGTRSDLLCLQETHLAELSQGKVWEKEWGGPCAWSPGSNRSAGVAVLIHPNSAATLEDFRADLAGRVVTAIKLSMFTRPITTVSVNYSSTISGVLNIQT